MSDLYIVLRSANYITTIYSYMLTKTLPYTCSFHNIRWQRNNTITDLVLTLFIGELLLQTFNLHIKHHIKKIP